MSETDADAKQSADVVIVGAGVLGCAIARELAPEYDVCVLEKGQIAGGTTAKASGLVTIVPDLPDHPEAAAHATEFFQAYDGTSAFSFTDRPSVHLVTEPEVNWAYDHADRLAGNGFDVEYLDTESLESRYPDVFVLENFAGGIEFRDTGWVDPYTYTTTLASDAEKAGALFETGREVTRVLADDGRVTGVEFDTNGGAERIDAPTVICATGWRTRPLLAEHVEVPVRPFRWQSVHLEVGRSFDESFPIGWESEAGLYWRPEHNGDLHVGGGTYFVNEPGGVETGITEDFRRLVATQITDRVANIEDARISATDTCTTGDAATPDDRPIVDTPAEAPDGLVIATGCPVGGVMTSPVVASAVRELVTGDPAPFPVEPFALDRFDSRGADFTCSYVSGRGVVDETNTSP